MECHMKNPHESIARGSLIEQAKVWFYFICLIILPLKHLSTVNEKEAVLLYAILKGDKFSVGKIIENLILSYYKGSYKGLVPHPELITRLCILGGVEGDWEEEETCPKTSPLTLTGIIKGPKNRGKEKEVEIGRDGRDNNEINQIQFDSATQEHQQRQNSLSPILIVTPDLRQTHQEQAESSERHGNNT